MDASQIRARLVSSARKRLRLPGTRRFERPPFDVWRKLRSRAEYEEMLAEARPRQEFEAALAAPHAYGEDWTVPGYCLVCEQPRDLIVDWIASVNHVPNWRERLQCPTCGLNNRQRFVAHLVRAAGARDVYLYEQITPFWEWARREYPSAIGSEYLGHDVPGGAVVSGVRHEDALKLSFASNSLDLIVSNDVFEHVPEIQPALSEAARVLRPGGRMLFSVPFYAMRDETVQAARLVSGGGIEHLEPPEYHGNPVDPAGGSLVFYQHGWDLLARCREAGFADAYAIGYWSALYGHIGGGLQLAFVATMMPASTSA